jgi:putative endonuclease
MVHFTYVIFSISSNKYYTGSSQNPQLRLKLHNDGVTKSTKSGIPWIIVYIETHQNKTSALKRD